MPSEAASVTHGNNEDVHVHFLRKLRSQMPFLGKIDSNFILTWFSAEGNSADQLTKSLEDAVRVLLLFPTSRVIEGAPHLFSLGYGGNEAVGMRVAYPSRDVVLGEPRASRGRVGDLNNQVMAESKSCIEYDPTVSGDPVRVKGVVSTHRKIVICDGVKIWDAPAVRTLHKRNEERDLEEDANGDGERELAAATREFAQVWAAGFEHLAAAMEVPRQADDRPRKC